MHRYIHLLYICIIAVRSAAVISRPILAPFLACRDHGSVLTPPPSRRRYREPELASIQGPRRRAASQTADAPDAASARAGDVTSRDHPVGGARAGGHCQGHESEVIRYSLLAI